MTARATPAKLYPDVEFRETRRPGFLNLKQLAAALGTTSSLLGAWVRKRLFRPDFYTARSVFFAEARLEEIKSKWANRRQKRQRKVKTSPEFVPVKGVITPFGVMLPRARPDAALLERLTLSREKRPSRDSSWKTRRRYNLKDLMP